MFYYKKRGLIYKANQNSTENHQDNPLVIPHVLKNQVLELTHDGHLGFRRTYKRI